VGRCGRPSPPTADNSMNLSLITFSHDAGTQLPPNTNTNTNSQNKTFNQTYKNPKPPNPLEKAYRNHLPSPNSSLVCRVSSPNQSNRRSTDVEQGHLIIQVHQTLRVKSNPQVRCICSPNPRRQTDTFNSR
jgi:hypothetical protein